MNNFHRNNKAIVTLAVPQGERPQLSQLCAIALINAYARQVQADVLVIPDRQVRVPGNDFVQWEKLRAFQVLDRYAQVLYLDSDVLIRPGAPSLFELCPEAPLLGRDEGRPEEAATLAARGFDISRWSKVGGRCRYFNAGVLLLRAGAGEIVARFNAEEAQRAVTVFFDQTYFNYLIHTTLEAQAIDRDWNWMNLDSQAHYRFQAHFIHHAGGGFGHPREQGLAQDYARLAQKPLVSVREPLRMREGGFLAGLQELVSWLGPIETLVEVGTYQGESVESFLRCAQNVLAIDPWQNGYDPNDCASQAVDAALVEAAFDHRHSLNPRVRKIRGQSLTACAAIPDRSVNAVYVDADHRYEPAKADLRAWLPKLKPGGVICGHDYWPGNFDGVVQAVNEVAGRPDRIFPDTSWAKRVA